MAKQSDLDKAYMECAIAISKLSRAERKKVGAILVSATGNHIIAEAFNGTPSNFENCCEIKIKHDYQDNDDWICVKCGKEFKENDETCFLKTKEEVIHAEATIVGKIAKSTNTSEGSTLYCTLSPCFDCAKQIIQAGIKRVVYLEQYPYAGHTGTVRLMGLELLEKAKITVEQLTS